MPKNHKTTAKQQGGSKNTPTSAVRPNIKRKPNSPAEEGLIDAENTNLSAIAMGINTILASISSMEHTLEANSITLTKFVDKVVASEKCIVSLETSNNFLLQARLNERMEITGFPQLPHSTNAEIRENTWKTLCSLGIDVEKSELADAYQTKRTIKEVEKVVTVAIFTHEAIRNRVMRRKAELKTAQSKEIFFNEVLTPFNRNLLYHARQMKKEGKLEKVGSTNGKIFVKKLNNEQKVFIENISNLEELVNLT